MHEAQRKRAQEGLNGTARKVFAAVPMAQPWSLPQILAEMRRTGCLCDARIAGGCLDALRGRGLVKEPERGMFIRVPVRVRPAAPIEDEELEMVSAVMVSPPVPVPPAGSPLDRLAALATQCRQQARGLEVVATQLEEVALDVQVQIDSERAGGEKLRQLQALLKGIA